MSLVHHGGPIWTAISLKAAAMIRLSSPLPRDEFLILEALDANIGCLAVVENHAYSFDE